MLTFASRECNEESTCQCELFSPQSEPKKNHSRTLALASTGTIEIDNSLDQSPVEGKKKSKPAPIGQRSRLHWHQIVEDYSSLKLTYASDRSPTTQPGIGPFLYAVSASRDQQVPGDDRWHR